MYVSTHSRTYDLSNPFDISSSFLKPTTSMSSSDNAKTVCPAAAVADLMELGIAFPGAASDCGSDQCPHCVRRRAANSTTSADTATEAQRQEGMRQAIEDFEVTEARTIPGRGGEEDESSPMIVAHTVKSVLEALYEDTSARELASINENFWVAADRQQPRLLNEIDARCGSVGEDCELVDINEPHIGLAEIDNA